MALSKLDSLYMAVVADHSKNPHHQGKLEDAEQNQSQQSDLWRCYQSLCQV